MKCSLSPPGISSLNYYLDSKKDLSPRYRELGDTRADFSERRNSPLRKRYDYDENRIYLGDGPEVFDQARSVLQNWQMFPVGWTKVFPADAPIESGQRVAVTFKVLGIWWWNSSEIQYTIDEADRFGFAYGTLPGHVESGEELFLIEMDEEGKVWYAIKAFSRPAYWLIKLVYPFARNQQRRFVRESMAQVKQLVINAAHYG